MSLAREVSERMRREGRGCSTADLRAIRDSLTPKQLERIRDKQRWEGCSLLAVLRDWPSMFEPEVRP